MADALGIPIDQLVKAATSSPDTSYIDRTKKELERVEKAKEAALAPVEEETIGRTKESLATAEAKRKALEGFDIQSWTQKMPERDPIASFGSLGSVFAVIASAFTHQPMINALNGAAAAMNALKAGDREAYEDAFKAWKENTQIALDRHKIQHEEYEDALAMMKTNLDAGTAMMNLIANKYKDQSVLVMNEAGLDHDRAQLFEARQRAALGLLQIYPQLEKTAVFNQLLLADPGYQRAMDKQKQGIPLTSEDVAGLIHATQNAEQAMTPSLLRPTQAGMKAESLARLADQFRSTHEGREPDAQEWLQLIRQNEQAYRAPTIAGEKGQLVEEMVNGGMSRADAIKNVELIGKMDPQSVDVVARLVGEGKMAPLSSFALRSEWGQAVMAQVGKLYPNYTGTEYGARSKAARDFFTGQQGNSIRSINVSVFHLETFQELMDALHNGDIVAFNAAAQHYNEQTGQPAPTNFDTAKQIIGPEIIKAIIATAGGVTERQALEGQFDRARSPEQLEGMVMTLKQLLAGQLRGFKRQYEQTTGFTNFESKLDPEARAALEGLGPTSAEPTTKPVPPAYKDQPDDTILYDSKNRPWKKKGDTLELQRQ